MTAARREWLPSPATLLATGAVVSLLALLEAGVLASDAPQRVSDSLQLLLAAAACASCLIAAPRSRGVARGFFGLLGLGCLAWACGQAFWVTRVSPFSPEATYAESDLLFVASTAFFLMAFVLRPDRGRVGPVPLAIDVSVVATAMLYLFCQLAVVHLLVGDVTTYELWSAFAFDFRGLALLPAILWSLRRGAPAWRQLYLRLTPAFVLLQLGSVLVNASFEPGSLVTRIAGPYHAGLYDLPWTLPYAWIAIVALRWRSVAEPASRGERAPVWRQARRATGVAFVAVLLFPLLHLAIAADDAPGSALARWRAGIALAGTLLVAGLYLTRQLLMMREAERVLREGEERYRALVDTSPDGVGVYGADLRVQYVSAAVTALGGYSPEERLGRSVLDVVHPDDAERLHADVGRALAAPGAVMRSAFRMRHRDGRWREIEVDLVNRLDEPAVRGIVANFRDLADRRRAEDDLERSRSLLEATLESTADGILVLDREGRIERYNQKVATMWRMPRALLDAGDNERALHFVIDQLQDPGAFVERVAAMSRDLASESFDTLHFRDGRVFERRALPQRLDGEVVGRVLSFRDVTERVHAEQAMARLVAIIEATPDYVGTCDASFRPLYLNRAGRRMVGLAPDEPLVQAHIREFHPERSALRLRDEAMPTALAAGVWSGETLLRHRDGHEIPVLQVVLAHRSPTGEVDFFSTIARDISQRIRAEEQLRRSHTMAALGALVAGVAHEVRNPLFGISSTLDAFEARFAGQRDQDHHVEVLRGELERLTGLMNDLLEYAKPQRLELVPGRLDDVVAQALAACAPLAERAQVRVESALDPDLPALRFDPLRLGQVFRNLLENAVQHSPRGGRVLFTAMLSPAPGGVAVECSVEDEGPGFAPSDLARVFEPFFSRRSGGTGLGLSIVQRIVTEHGGTIAAYNRPGGGARLTVSLPTTFTA